MSDISRGPISTLAGTLHYLPEGARCDDHPDRPAVARVQGETDSFGCEFLDLCQECLTALRQYRQSAEARTGDCEWCKRPATDLRDRRDFEEGMYGRVYRVCGECTRKDNERIQAEIEQYDDRGGEWDDDGGDDDWEDDDWLEELTPLKAAADGSSVVCGNRLIPVTYRKRKDVSHG